MKGDTKVLELLNDGLRSELTAVSQFWLHYRLLEDWGIEHLAWKAREESIEEMQHADRLIERIIFLEGHPNLQKLDSLRIGENVKEVLEADLAAEKEALELYRRGRLASEEANDSVSKKLFEDLILDEEGHMDFLERQLGLLEKMGEANYIQLNSAHANTPEPSA